MGPYKLGCRKKCLSFRLYRIGDWSQNRSILVAYVCWAKYFLLLYHDGRYRAYANTVRPQQWPTKTVWPQLLPSCVAVLTASSCTMSWLLHIRESSKFTFAFGWLRSVWRLLGGPIMPVSWFLFIDSWSCSARPVFSFRRFLWRFFNQFVCLVPFSPVRKRPFPVTQKFSTFSIPTPPLLECSGSESIISACLKVFSSDFETPLFSVGPYLCNSVSAGFSSSCW